MDFELFSTQEAFDLATSQTAEAFVEGARSLDPIAATAIATVIVSSLLFAVRLTRHFAVTISVRFPEINTKSLNLSSMKLVSGRTPMFSNILEPIQQQFRPREPATPYQVTSIVRGKVN